MTDSSPGVPVFVSHSSADEPLARALVELFQKALRLSARDIRCTSVDGYKLPVGAATGEQLRREIVEASAFIGLITPASAASMYVLFELGARWGARRHLAPVLARSADMVLLGGPLSTVNALVLTERAQVFQLVQDIGEHLKLQLEPIASFERSVDVVVAAANASHASLPKTFAVLSAQTAEELAVLQFLASVPDDSTAEQIAQHLKLTEQKAKFFLEELASNKMVLINPVFYGITTYSITQEGRRLLVQKGML